MTINRLLTMAGAAALGLTMATSAMAIPELQLFIEGADYETSSENTSVPPDSETWAELGTTSFRLWVIGGGAGSINATHRIRDVMFVASFNTGLDPSLVFTSTTTGGAAGFTDPSTPVATTGPTPVDIDGLVPPPGDSPLTNHSPLGAANRSAVQWKLGMFDLADSPIADFQPAIAVEAADNWFPGPVVGALGQINVYDVLVSNLLVGEEVHFDVYGIAQVLISSGWVDVEPNQYVNAPFSHDARWEQIDDQQIVVEAPEPASLTLLGAGLLGLGYFGRRRKAA